MTLKVIGAGLCRTGTFSLKKALEQLGFGPCFHHAEITRDGTLAFNWAKLAQGVKVEWEEIFAGWSATVDIPSVTYWRELVDHYPDAKVVLSTRDPERWYTSMAQTLLSDRPHSGSERNQAQPPEVRAARYAMIEKSCAPFEGDHDQLIAYFHRHSEEVKRHLPPERLLVHEASHGWEPLCRFLGVPVPAEPYPRTNSMEEFGTAWEQL